MDRKNQDLLVQINYFHLTILVYLIQKKYNVLIFTNKINGLNPRLKNYLIKNYNTHAVLILKIINKL